MIKAIIFDCFGVLTVDHWKEFVSSLSAEQAEEARNLMYEHDAGRLDEPQLLDHIKRMTGRLPVAVEALLPDELAKNSELLNYIKAELEPSYKIGLLSNIGSNWVRDKFLSKEEQLLFNDMIFSHEVGMAKPDRRIFELAANRLGVELENCLLVDDSAGNCVVAKQLGAQTIIYENFVQMKAELGSLLNSKS